MSPQGVTDALRHEPSGAIGTEAQLKLQLLRRQVPPAGGHEKKGKQPFVQRHVAMLHRGSHSTAEFVSAFPAQKHSRLGASAHPNDVLRLTPDASGPVWPTYNFYILTRGIFVVEKSFPRVEHLHSPLANSFL